MSIRVVVAEEQVINAGGDSSVGDSPVEDSPVEPSPEGHST
ncbi:hypothetical protein [Streptomyces sp. 7N604]